MEPPPIPSKDAEHLRTLAICHYVVAGLSVFGIGFLLLHYSFMKMFFANPKLWEEQSKAMEKSGAVMPFNPAELLQIFQWFYLIAGVWIVVSGVLTFMSGRCLHRRTHRTFSIVIAGLNCLHFPFGTALGIFTLIVLTKDSVFQLYAVSKPQTASV